MWKSDRSANKQWVHYVDPICASHSHNFFNHIVDKDVLEKNKIKSYIYPVKLETLLCSGTVLTISCMQIQGGGLTLENNARIGENARNMATSIPTVYPSGID